MIENIFTIGTDTPVIAGRVGPLEDALVTGDVAREVDIDQSHPCDVVTDVVFLRGGLPSRQNKPNNINHDHTVCRPVILPVETLLKTSNMKANDNTNDSLIYLFTCLGSCQMSLFGQSLNVKKPW